MKRNSIILSALLACSLSSIAQSQTETFFSVTSADNQAQGMAMVLATQMAEPLMSIEAFAAGLSDFLPQPNQMANEPIATTTAA